MDWESLGSGGKGSSSLHLTETEHRYYGDIFIYCCENAETEHVPSVKVGELLRSANLPHDVTIKILDICEISKTNTLSRRQFYAVLKLVAAHQAGLEVNKDIIFAQVDEIALPRFQWPTNTSDDLQNLEKSSDNSKTHSKFSSKYKNSSKKSSKKRRNLLMPDSTTDSEEEESEPESPRENEACSTDSPTPTNSVTQERTESGNIRIMGDEEGNLDSVMTGGSGWQSLLISEEQRQLLGTEEESSERHSSDEGNDDAFPSEQVWVINDEQREYYAAQFAQLQPNPEGLLAGSLARKFFEKSRLPVEELRKIWQLADVTRDSALSLQEFYVAMHLAVVRRNHVPLPDILPPALISILETQKLPVQPPPPPPPIIQQSSVPPVPAPRGSPKKPINREKSKEWTKFVDSPTGTSASNLTSPGPKPVNFDFQKSALERDPKILHPVPLRLTPEAAILASNANGNNGVGVLLGDEEIQVSTSSLIQRPLAKKPLPVPEDAVIATPKKEPPPPPPPRPYRTHTRSSSLDLNKLDLQSSGKNGQTVLGAPPLIPPRVSPGITSPRTRLVYQKSEDYTRMAHNMDEQCFVADFSQFAPKLGENQTVENNVPPPQQFAGVCGAFHIYKKPVPRNGDEDLNKDETDIAQKLTLQELREVNAELRQVCEELTTEWAGALQERINLKAKLLLLT